MELTAWKGIRNPGKKPIMHRCHCSELSRSMSSVIFKLWPAGCRGSCSRVNRVLESETRTLSAQEDWPATGLVLWAVGLVFNIVGCRASGFWWI